MVLAHDSLVMSGFEWQAPQFFFSLPELNWVVVLGLPVCLSVPPSYSLKTLFDLQLDT